MKSERIFNFSAGPAVLPVPVLEQAQRDLVSLPGCRHVDSRSEPPIEGIRGRARARRSRHQAACQCAIELPRAVSAGRRKPAVHNGADEFAGARRDRRLCGDGCVVGEGGGRSEEDRKRARGRDDEGGPVHAHPARRGNCADARCGLRAHDLEQHDLRHRVEDRCPRSATSRW